MVRLDLGHVVLPDWHPRHADGVCALFGYAVDHPDGVVVFDTGCGVGNEFIDAVYEPAVVDIVDALNAASIDERDVGAIVNSHLHFDHCGQNHRLPHAPFWVQAEERDVARTEFFTVPEWADVDSDRIRVAGDTEVIAPGVTIVATPGHTPGHQSLLVETGAGLEIVAGQPCYTCAEFTSASPDPDDMFDASHFEMGLDSIRRLAALDTMAVHLAHDAESIVRP